MMTYEEVEQRVGALLGEPGDEVPEALVGALLALDGVPQAIRWHPEGDALRHTLLVAAYAKEVIVPREEMSPTEALVLVLAALVHDVGKVSTTAVNKQPYRAEGALVTVGPGDKVTSYGHEVVGAVTAYELAEDFGFDEEPCMMVRTLVREHMAHYNLPEPGGGAVRPKAVRRLAEALAVGYCTPNLWAWLIEADHGGRPPLPGEPVKPAVLAAVQAAYDKLLVTR